MALTAVARDAAAEGVPLKLCGTCGHHYPATLEFFYVCATNPDGLRYACKECTKKAARDRQRRIRAGLPGRTTPKYEMGDTRPCAFCKVPQPWTTEFFAVNHRNPDGSIRRLDYTCRACRREDVRRRYWEDVEASRERDRQQREERLARDPERYRRLARKHGAAYRRRQRAKLKDPFLPVGPMVEWIDRKVKTYPFDPFLATNNAQSGGQLAMFLRDLSTAAPTRTPDGWGRLIRRWRSENKGIRESDADAILTGFDDGTRLHDLWPELYR